MAEQFTGSITAGYRRTLRLEGERGTIELELRVTVPAGTPDNEVDAAVRSAQRTLDALRTSIDTRISESTHSVLPVIETKPALSSAITSAQRPLFKPVPADNEDTEEREEQSESENMQPESTETQRIPLNQVKGEVPQPAPLEGDHPSTHVEKVTPVPASIARPAQRQPHEQEQDNAEAMPVPIPPVQRPASAAINELPALYDAESVSEPDVLPESSEKKVTIKPAVPVRPMTPTASRWNFGSKRNEPEETGNEGEGDEEQEQPRKQAAPPPASELQEAVANVVSLPRRAGTPPPRNTKPAEGQNPRIDLPATPQQIQSIRSMATEELRLSDTQFESKIREMTGRTLDNITRNQAFSVIVDLRREINQRNSGEEMTELERARAVVAPIGPFKGKTLGEIEAEKPGAVNYFINARGVSPEVQEAARIIVNNRPANQQG